MSRRRKRAANGSGDGDLIDALLEIARLSPALGLTVAAATFAIGAFLFWGDPHRWTGLVPLAGIPLLLLAALVAAASAVFFLRDKARASQTSGPRPSRFTTPPYDARSGHVDGASCSPPPRDGRAFERVIAVLYRRSGYDVEETGRHGEGTDGGVDLVLRVPAVRAGDPGLSDDAGADVLVQCKDYAKGWVSVDQMRAFFGTVCGWSATATHYASRARRGVFVTTRFFSDDARAFAEANGIELIDGRALADRLTAAGLPVPYEVPPRPADTPATRPICPRCRIPMTLRQPGPRDTWTAFWGCPNYGKRRCRQTIKAR